MKLTLTFSRTQKALTGLTHLKVAQTFLSAGEGGFPAASSFGTRD